MANMACALAPWPVHLRTCALAVANGKLSLVYFWSGQNIAMTNYVTTNPNPINRPTITFSSNQIHSRRASHFPLHQHTKHTMRITTVAPLARRLIPTYPLTLTLTASSAGPRGRRAFSHSSTARDSDRSIADPTYPDLHYHPNSSPNPDSTTPYFALSFFPSLPVSRTLLIGWTPARETNGAPALSPATFVGNEPFVELLHEVVGENVGEGDESMKAAAEWQKEGWLHVADARNPPPFGRIPYPEDIVGSVLVQAGRINPTTYQPNPTHRLVTPDGLFRLNEPLHTALVKRCREEAARADGK